MVVVVVVVGGYGVYYFVKDDTVKGVVKMNNCDIVEVLDRADSIECWVDNEKHSINKDSLMESIELMMNGSHEMPAFGVSLDEETKGKMKAGVWVQFNYDKTCEYNEMRFDSLLIEIRRDDNGFNIIRKYENKYEGRCYYVDLAGDMAIVYNYILGIDE